MVYDAQIVSEAGKGRCRSGRNDMRTVEPLPGQERARGQCYERISVARWLPGHMHAGRPAWGAPS